MTTKVDERISNAVAAGLKRWRLGAGLIQREVARRCKLTEPRLSKIERAAADLKPSELERLAAVDTEIDWIAILPFLSAAILRQNEASQNGNEPSTKGDSA